MNTTWRRKQIQNLPKVFNHRVRAVGLGELYGVFFLRGAEDDAAANSGFLGTGDVPLHIVRLGGDYSVLRAYDKIPRKAWEFRQSMPSSSGRASCRVPPATQSEGSLPDRKTRPYSALQYP